MNPRTISKEELKNGFEEETLKELDDLAEQATGQPLYSPPIDTIINGRKKNQPMLEMCQQCIATCKKYTASRLTNFECFVFTKRRRK